MSKIIDIFVSLGLLNLLSSTIPNFIGMQDYLVVHKGKLQVSVLMTYLGLHSWKHIGALDSRAIRSNHHNLPLRSKC